MPLDRFGDRIFIAYSETEIVWIRAAITLPTKAKLRAFHDIASMTSRSFEAIRKKGYNLHCEDMAARFAARPLLEPAQAVSKLAPAIPPSELRQPSLASKMAGR